MALAADFLARALRGHLACEPDPAGGWRIWRHTVRQRAVLDAREVWAVRIRCPAGVRLALAGCGAWVELDFAVEAQARSWGAVDGGPPGLPVLRHQRAAIPRGAIWTIRFDLPEELREGSLELWLPHSQAGRLLDLRAARPPVAAPVPPRRRLLALGDSITQGMVAAGPAGGYAMQLARLLDADLLNQGVGGHIFDVAGFDRDLPWEPDLITVAYGTNDWSQGLATSVIAVNAAAHLAAVRARYPAVPLVLVTPFWRQDCGQPRPGGTFAAACDAIANAGAGTATLVVDGRRLAPHDPFRLADGVHPDEAGMAAIALGLFDQLRTAGLA